VREETEEEFLERYALAAAGESIEAIEEGDIDEDTQDIELGKFLTPIWFLPKTWGDSFMTTCLLSKRRLSG
jgi:hypothetical protein